MTADSTDISPVQKQTWGRVTRPQKTTEWPHFRAETPLRS